MQRTAYLVRGPGDRELPSSFVRVPTATHRPKERFLVRLDSPADVKAARKKGLAVALLDSERSEALGYPLEFSPCALVYRDLLPIVTGAMRVIPVSDESAARHPTLEDYVVAMLPIDSLGARRILVEHRTEIDRSRLLKRVLQENVEQRAYHVRLAEFAPGLPKVEGVKQLASRDLAVSDRREFTRTVGRRRKRQ